MRKKFKRANQNVTVSKNKLMQNIASARATNIMNFCQVELKTSDDEQSNDLQSNDTKLNKGILDEIVLKLPPNITVTKKPDRERTTNVMDFCKVELTESENDEAN